MKCVNFKNKTSWYSMGHNLTETGPWKHSSFLLHPPNHLGGIFVPGLHLPPGFFTAEGFKLSVFQMLLLVRGILLGANAD